MRIFLDNNIPRDFKLVLAGLDVHHTTEVGLDQFEDGALLEALAGRFEVLVTMDRSLPHQQNLGKRSFAVVILRARNNRMPTLTPLATPLRRQLPFCQPGQVYEISA
jgi:predicted nuclease of predicted toxin-antitoxin system